MDRLRALGYVVDATAGTPGYRLGAGTGLPPLLLDDEEAVAVAIGLGGAATAGVSGIEEAALRALDKLERVLPSRLRHRVSGLRSMTVTVPGAVSTVDPGTLTAIAAAARGQESLRFDYRSHDGTESLRTAEPYRLAHTARRWYLVGWDVGRRDWRTYRVDRLQLRSPNGPRFVPRELPDTDVVRYVSQMISTAPYRYHGRFTLHASAEAVARQMPPTVATIDPIDDRHCVLHAGSNSLDELVLWVARIGVTFEIHEPPELKGHIRQLANRLLAAGSQRTGPGSGPGD